MFYRALCFWSLGVGMGAMLYAEPLQVDVAAAHVILMNADTGAILYEKQAHQPTFPASVTKIGTALYLLKRGGVSLDTVLVVEPEAVASVAAVAKKRSNHTLPAHWLEFDAVHMGLKQGERMALGELLKGMLITSANDAANVVAQYVGGSIPQFTKGMNGYLREIGCTQTHFKNPHGLHHPDHQTTAYDLALMTREALKIPQFCEIVASPRYMRPKTNLQAATVMLQGNRLLRKGPVYYPKAIGVKTGYTAAAQHSLVAAARSEGRTLIAVLLQNPDRTGMFRDAIKLFETAFNQPKVERVLLREGKQKFVLNLTGAVKGIETNIPAAVKIQYYPAEEPEIQALLHWKELSLPIAKGQEVGEVRLTTKGGGLLRSVPLYAADNVRATWVHRMTSLSPFGTVLGLFVLVFLLFTGWRFLRRRA